MEGREVRKTVTVVFCDVVGSTSIGERLDAEALRDVQQRYFAAMRGPIERHGGTIEKFIGDAVMAVFGIPVASEDDALRAVRAAAEMRDAIPALSEELERDRGIALRVRIGVNTGPVVASDVADAQAFVTGDTVNVAARLEQHAPPGAVLFGETTFRLVRDTVEAEAVEPVAAKGKDAPVAAWRLERVRARDGAVPRRLTSPLVGREEELAALAAALRRAIAEGRPRLVTVVAGPGVGKSRLVEEFLARHGAGARVLRGRCLSYGEGITYLPAAEVIRDAAGIAGDEPARVVEAEVRAVLEGDDRADLAWASLAELLGVGAPGTGEDPTWAIRRFVEAVARRGPVVLVLDDIHWAEPALLDLVETLVARASGAVLMVCIARPELLETRPSWGRSVDGTAIALPALGEGHAATLVANLLGSADLDGDDAPDFRARIVATAQGNPLFIEQLFAMLVDDGVLVRGGERWDGRDLERLPMPPSIEALLASRLDRLPPEARTVVEAGSIVGERFERGDVEALVADAVVDVPSALDDLARKELVLDEGRGAWRFRHILVRDAAYATITKARRAELHERVADHLERSSERPRELDEIAGFHLEQAHAYRRQLAPSDGRLNTLADRASSRLASAGVRASGRGDAAAAVNLVTRALALRPRPDRERARLLYELAEAHWWTDDAPAAYASFDDAYAVASAAGDERLATLSSAWRTWARFAAEPTAVGFEEARADLEAAARQLEGTGDHAALASVWTALTWSEWYPGRFDAAAVAARRAVEHAERSGDARLLANAAIPLCDAPTYGSATAGEIRSNLDAWGDVFERNVSARCFAIAARAFASAMDGSFDEARALLAEAIELAVAVDNGFVLGALYEKLAYVEAWAGSPDRAERLFRAQYDHHVERGDEGHRSGAAVNLARVLCSLERWDEAASFARLALDISVEDDVMVAVVARQALALASAARGDEGAEAPAREAVEIAARAENPMLLGDAWLDVAEVVLRLGRRDEAREAAHAALACFERKGMRPRAHAARAVLARC